MIESSFLSEMVNNIIKSKPKIRPITKEECRKLMYGGDIHSNMAKICELCGKRFGNHYQANCTLNKPEIFHIKNG